jgi:hypothetical protein
MFFIYIKKLVNLNHKKKQNRFFHLPLVGFVVGQTEQDWQRMSDNYDPTQKLNQYKYI